MREKTFIIAEAGVNHNGSLELAKKLIDAAAHAGADAVKFQTFKTESLVTRSAGKAEYQKATTSQEESQFQMLKKLELDVETHRTLMEHCKNKKILFLSTPFDLESIDLLVSLGVTMIKIPSGEITNAPYLLKIARQGLPVILSTGMTDLAEIEQALGVLAFGFLNKKEKPSMQAFKEAYASKEGASMLQEKVTLLHATTQYPTPVFAVNLRAMETMEAAFELRVGYSDHTNGIAIPTAAVALGAVIIEKHFTLDRSLPGPDHKASLEPNELEAMVKAIREVEASLGHGRKVPSGVEVENMPVARKSLVASDEVKKGEIFTESNLGVKRPGTGISPFRYWDYLGKQADADLKPDELIK